MRALVRIIGTAAAIALHAAQAQAAPGGVLAQPDIPTLKQLVQDFYYGDHRPACPYGSHYSCWFEPYGLRYCACWPRGDRPACPSGYYYACRAQPNGYRSCGCY